MVQNKTTKRELEQTAELVHRLIEISIGSPHGDEDQLRELLVMGCEIFDLEVGIVTRIDRGRYEVIASVHPEEVPVTVGTITNLGNTFCDRTIDAGGPTYFESAKSAKLTSHPAYETFRFESYLGALIRVGDEVYGTLSFAGRKPRKPKFGSLEVDCLRVMAAWSGAEIGRRHVETELEAASRELEASRERLEKLASQDPLTGVLNRKAVLKRLGDERDRAEREGATVGVFIMDVDEFKRVNDTFGHHGGDVVLQEIVERINSTLRSYDHLGRFGGEEFLAVLPGCTIQEAAEIAERARLSLSDAPFSRDNGQVDVTASFGVSSTADSQLSDDKLLGFADRALDLAKQLGANRVRGASPRV